MSSHIERTEHLRPSLSGGLMRLAALCRASQPCGTAINQHTRRSFCLKRYIMKAGQRLVGTTSSVALVWLANSGLM